MTRILIYIAIVLSLFAVPIHAQSSPVSVEASIDRQQAYIGDVLKYRITVEADTALSMDSIRIGAFLGEFEVLRSEQSEVITDDVATRVFEYDLAAFETGRYAVPPTTVRFTLSDGGTAEAATDSLPVVIMSVASGDSLADIRGLKDPIPIGYRFPWLYVAIGAALALVLGYLLWRILKRKKVEEEAEKVDTRPPWVIAEERLRKLRESELIENEQFKLFYLKLTEIVRRYLEPRFGIDAIDRTTWELREEMMSIGLSEEQYNSLFALFDSADLVKFAKSVPTPQLIEDDFQRAWAFVRNTSVSEVKEVSAT